MDERLVTMYQTTMQQYNTKIQACQAVFKKKTQDYGTAWRILRLPSLTDQIMIKAKRIRMLQEQGLPRVNENTPTELIGIINYCIMSLMQIDLQDDPRMDLTYSELAPLYEDIVANTRALLSDKNHDYQEAWRSMRVQSITDIILMKLLRIKRIEDNHGTTLVSEGVDANYRDIINYAVFALIQLDAIPH